MAHYAFMDSNNVVVKVIKGVDETVTQDDNGTEVGGSTEAWESFYANQPWHEGLTCKRTSYNNNIRGVYAGIGYTYDAEKDIFLPPKPYPSWVLNESNNWVSPILPPNREDNPEASYSWDETNQNWVIAD